MKAINKMLSHYHMWKHEKSTVLEHFVSVENFVSIEEWIQLDWNYLETGNEFFIQNN